MANPTNLNSNLFVTHLHEVVSHYNFSVVSGAVTAINHYGIVKSVNKTATGTYDLILESWPVGAFMTADAAVSGVPVAAAGTYCQITDSSSSTSAPKITLKFFKADLSAAADPPDGMVHGSIHIQLVR